MSRRKPTIEKVEKCVKIVQSEHHLKLNNKDTKSKSLGITVVPLFLFLILNLGECIQTTKKQMWEQVSEHVVLKDRKT